MPFNRKQEKERARREELRNERKERKIRRLAETEMGRDDQELSPEVTILIVCEGKNTEPSYFEQFKLQNADIDIYGEGRGTISLVDAALARLAQSGKKYDHKWVVYDKDDFPEDQFDNAIHKANANDFKVAYSNQAFEYWLLLHFEAHQGGGMDRKDCLNKLNVHLAKHGQIYDSKSKRVETDVFETLLSLDDRKRSLQELAIKRSKKIFKHHTGTAPHAAESSTTVHELVEKLREFMK